MNARIYAAANVLFALMVILGSTAHPDVAHPLYLLLLFAICSSPLLDVGALNDRFALLIIFSVEYFLMYGLLDFMHLLFGVSSPGAAPKGLFDDAETVILVGGALTQIFYRVACAFVHGRPSPPRRTDWPERTAVVFGSVLWVVSTYISWRIHVDLIVDNSIQSIESGYSQLGTVQATFYMIAIYLQPMCIVMLAYAQCRYRKLYLLPIIAVALAVEMVYGFVSDTKGQVFIGLALIALTKYLVEGKIPKLRIGVALAFIICLYPILQANRAMRGEYDINRVDVAHNIVLTFERALSASRSASEGTDHVETFYERGSLKSSVEMIVQRTGKDVAYQNGYTLVPILSTFIPRIFWPDKPNVETGRIVNEQFQVTQQEETYISPSHLGELYWNYGWAGVIVGMSLIGALLGFIGGWFDLSRFVSLSRVLVLLATAKLLVLSFESAIAGEYVSWIRTMVALGAMHLVFAKTGPTSAQLELPATESPPPRWYPNLLR